MNKKERELKNKGFYWIRDYHPWGKCPTYRNSKHEIKFFYQDRIWTRKQLYNDLRKNWVPQAQDEVFFKMHKMKEYFGQ